MEWSSISGSSRGNSLPLILISHSADPTLLARDVASVMEKVEGKKYLLGDFFKLLRVPESKVVANRMVAASWWVSYSHAPSWAKLVSILITCQERRALKEARKFLPIPTPGQL